MENIEIKEKGEINNNIEKIELQKLKNSNNANNGNIYSSRKKFLPN
jgi:hypothetical protein